jgi:hypothetical protein
MGFVKLIYPLDQADTLITEYEVGSRTITKDGNEYIYLPGIVSCAKYDWVVYKTTGTGLSYGSVTRMVNGTAGMVGIAQAAITGPKYGWFLIKGVGWGNAGEAFSSGSPLYSSGTTATVGTTFVASTAVYGAIGLGTSVSQGTAKVLLNYPMLYAQVL